MILLISLLLPKNIAFNYLLPRKCDCSVVENYPKFHEIQPSNQKMCFNDMCILRLEYYDMYFNNIYFQRNVHLLVRYLVINYMCM